jgi:hypothetical protein
MPFYTVKTRLERFEAFFDKGTGCWLWKGSKTDQGYGHFFNSRFSKPHSMKAHRQSWLLYKGPIPDGLLVLHKCDTPSCVNPDHLFLGTNDDNIDDRNAKERQSRGGRHTPAKLTEYLVRKIREHPIPSDFLAQELGVTVRTINQIRARESWRHVK